MSQENYIGNLLNIKDKNIKFYKNFCEAGISKGKKCKFINAIYLIFLLIAKSVVLYLTLKTTMRRKDFLIGPPMF